MNCCLKFLYLINYYLIQLTGEMPDNDIVPIFLATKTQELFNCIADDQVTEQSPYKLISKQSALNDLHDRAAVSDFHPVKQIVTVSFYDFNFVCVLLF